MRETKFRKKQALGMIDGGVWEKGQTNTQKQDRRRGLSRFDNKIKKQFLLQFS